MGWNSAFNNAEEITPTLDAMVASSLRLGSFYVYKYCSPTRGSFLSGRYPFKLCATRNNLNPATIPEGIHLGYTYISEKLKAANPPYLSYQVGKWHQGLFAADYTPVGRGFNASFGFLSGGEDHYSQHNFWGCPNAPATDLYQGEQPAIGKNGSYNGFAFTDAAIRFVTEHVDKHPANPFFLYFALHNTHAPVEAPADTVALYNFSQSLRNEFNAMTSIVDESVKNVTNALKELGIWENTLFIWTNDNGSPVSVAGSNYPFRGSKGNNFEGGVHVPALLSGGVLPEAMRGRVLDGVVHIADFYSTFCHLAGGIDPTDTNPDAPSPIDSLNMWPYLSGAVQESPRNLTVFDHLMFSGVAQGAIRSGRYKLVMMNESEAGWYGQFSPNETWNKAMADIYACSVDAPCLFDIVSDPTEHVDLAKVLPNVTSEMIDLFHSLDDEYHPPKQAPPDDKDGYCEALYSADGFVVPWRK